MTLVSPGWTMVSADCPRIRQTTTTPTSTETTTVTTATPSHNRKIKAIDIDDTEKLDKERKKLKTRYLVFNNHIFIGYRICFI